MSIVRLFYLDHMVDRKIEVHPDTRLEDCEQRPVGVALSAPMSERLDDLVRLADLQGARTSRRELIAALILAAPAAATELTEAVLQYRRALVREALVLPTGGAEVISLSRRRPGPRKRGMSSAGNSQQS
jgi:hypothetical protein